MLIGQRLREIRKAKHLSQDDIEQARGLVCPTFLALKTGIPFQAYKKCVRALHIPLYRVLFEGEGPPKPPKAHSKLNKNGGKTVDAKDDNWTGLEAFTTDAPLQ